MIVLIFLTLLLQPFGHYEEDAITPAQVLQPAHSPQVSRHGFFLQPAHQWYTGNLQADVINLDSDVRLNGVLK